MKHTISNKDDVIDTRDLIARVEDLESDLEVVHDNLVGESDESRTFDEWLEEQTTNDNSDQHEDAEELATLKKFAEEVESYCADYKHGECLVREDHFEEYAREMAQDICQEQLGNAQWPLNCIDWEKAADELKQDYSTAEFDGVTYFYRS